MKPMEVTRTRAAHGADVSQGSKPTVAFGSFQLDPADARLLRDGRPVPLTPKAFDVLHFLVQRPDRLVTKEELLSAVWPDVIVTDASIKVCVREIRKALGDESKTPQYVETVHRRGYRFIAPVQGSLRNISDPVPSQAPAARVATAPDVSPAARHPLVGRDAENSQLVGRYRLAANGERQVVFVAGGPGTGKTALVESFVTTAASQGAVVLVGRC